MRKFLFVLAFAAVFISSTVYAACTLSTGSVMATGAGTERGAQVTYTVSCDAGGGSLSNQALNVQTLLRDIMSNVTYRQLHWVEFAPNGTNSPVITIETVAGTPMFSTVLPSSNRRLPGHMTVGVFPELDQRWQLDVGTMAANDTFTMTLGIR